MTPADTALALGATARLTRLVVADDLGQWWFKDRLSELAATNADHHDGVPPAWWRYVSGLSCPHCVSFHAAYVVLGSHALMRHHPTALAVWRFGAGALTLSYLVGHAGARLGDTATE